MGNRRKFTNATRQGGIGLNHWGIAHEPTSSHGITNGQTPSEVPFKTKKKSKRDETLLGVMDHLGNRAQGLGPQSISGRLGWEGF